MLPVPPGSFSWWCLLAGRFECSDALCVSVLWQLPGPAHQCHCVLSSCQGQGLGKGVQRGDLGPEDVNTEDTQGLAIQTVVFHLIVPSGFCTLNLQEFRAR